MEIVQWLIDFISGLVWMAVDFVAQLLLSVSGSASDMTEAEAQFFAIGFWLLIGFAYVARHTFWGGGLAIFRPMTITLSTTKTPWQVLMSDLRSCLVTLVAVIMFVLLIYSVAAGR